MEQISLYLHVHFLTLSLQMVPSPSMVTIAKESTLILRETLLVYTFLHNQPEVQRT